MMLYYDVNRIRFRVLWWDQVGSWEEAGKQYMKTAE